MGHQSNEEKLPSDRVKVARPGLTIRTTALSLTLRDNSVKGKLPMKTAVPIAVAAKQSGLAAIVSATMASELGLMSSRAKDKEALVKIKTNDKTS
jgi:hypothetical protein